jgi:hypothetical protein
MKGINGLIVAAGLGIVGALVNFYYLNTEAQKKDMVAFIGIKKGVILGRGDKLSEDKLVKVEIPANHVGNLKDYACLWDESVGIKDRPVWRTLDSSNTEGGLLLLRGDYREPPKDLELGKGERGQFITVPKNFDASHLNPGDRVAFRVMTLTPPGPTRAPVRPAAAPAAPATGAAASETAELQPKPEEPEAAPQLLESSEIIGPFVIVSIGNRLGTLEAQKAAKIAPVAQNLLLLRISKNVPGEEERFEKLATAIHRLGPNCYDIQVLGKE